MLHCVQHDNFLYNSNFLDTLYFILIFLTFFKFLYGNLQCFIYPLNDRIKSCIIQYIS